MTRNQAARLQLQWKQRADRRPCQHRHQEVERSDEGYVTATHHCSLCGQVLLRVFKDSHLHLSAAQIAEKLLTEVVLTASVREDLKKLKKASVSVTLSLSQTPANLHTLAAGNKGAKARALE